MEEIYSILDRIMKLNHEVVDYYIKMANNEIMRMSQDKDLSSEAEMRLPQDRFLSKTVETRMNMIQELYRELREKVKKEGEVQTEERYSAFGVITKEGDNKVDDNIYVDIKKLMEEYIEESYLQMNFISDEETETYSIYEGTVEERIRESEYESYRNNILTLENISKIDETSNISSLNYIQIASLIEDLSDNSMYEKSFKRISKVIEKLENGEYKFNSDGERNRIRNKLIYMKYDELYKEANQTTNSVAVNCKYAPQIRMAQEDQYVHGILGVTESDYGTIYQSRICEYLDDIKQDVRNVFRDNRDNIKKSTSKIKLPNIGNVVSKLADLKDSVKAGYVDKRKQEDAR